MIGEFRIRRIGDRKAASLIARPCRLSCVWIETGNPRRPLASVWIDEAMRSFSDPEGSTDHEPWPLCA